MGEYFDDAHASWRSQLQGGVPCEVEDSQAVLSAGRRAGDYEGFLALGNGLSRQLRYREAINAYTEALKLQPDNLAARRLRAGRHLSLLQCDEARADLLRCMELGGDSADIIYRMGLCSYFQRRYEEAMGHFEECITLCGDEMGIAVIYWHTLSAYRSHTPPLLLGRYHPEMKVGHHTAYEKAVCVCAGARTCESLLAELEEEKEDLEYGTALYGICGWLSHAGRGKVCRDYREQLLRRDGFWPCYAYLAAWNDALQDGIFRRHWDGMDREEPGWKG